MRSFPVKPGSFAIKTAVPLVQMELMLIFSDLIIGTLLGLKRIMVNVHIPCSTSGRSFHQSTDVRLVKYS